MKWTFHTATTEITTNKRIRVSQTARLVHAVEVSEHDHIKPDAIAVCGYKTSGEFLAWVPTVLPLSCPRCQKKLHYVLNDVKFWEIGKEN